MASFSEYHHPIPASESNDFVLYSTQETYPDLMPTSHPYNTNPYLNSTGAGFEPFSIQSFSSTPYQPADFSFAAASAPQAPKGNYQPHTPAESPTNSANNSFDIQPPNLSSTSDSGASVQSTSSSAMGSPSLNPSNYVQEPWSTLGQGLGLGVAPGIVQPDQLGQEHFGTSGLEYDPLLGHDKIPGCVGESPSISSPQRSLQPTSFPTFSSSQNQSQYSSSNIFPTGQRSSFPRRAARLDTSTAGHASPYAAPSLQTPTSANPYPRQGQQPVLRRTNSASRLTASGAPEFKSPSTPASATRPRTFSPPASDRRGSLLNNSVPTDTRTGIMFSPVSGSSRGISAPTASQSTSPFSQSNGNFVAPLGSYCWFPCPCLLSYFRIFAFPLLHFCPAIEP